jgi:hypothetical protein
VTKDNIPVFLSPVVQLFEYIFLQFSTFLIQLDCPSVIQSWQADSDIYILNGS